MLNERRWRPGAQLGGSAPNLGRRVDALDGAGHQVDDTVAVPEVGDVLEGQIDGSGDSARAAQGAQLVELSLPAIHGATVSGHADPVLLARCAPRLQWDPGVLGADRPGLRDDLRPGTNAAQIQERVRAGGDHPLREHLRTGVQPGETDLRIAHGSSRRAASVG